MLKYIIFVIGIISCIIGSWSDISAYLRKEYDPIIFREKREYEDSIPKLIEYCGGILIPTIYLYCSGLYYSGFNLYVYGYFCIILVFHLLIKTILNLKCYSKTKKKRIVIETVIYDLLVSFIIICPVMFFE